MIPFLLIMSRLPLSVLYVFGDVIGFLASWFYRRTIVKENIRRVFTGYEDRQVQELTMRFYSRLAELAMETLKMLTIAKEDLRQRVCFINPELINEAAKKGPVMVLAPHLVNWEWMALASSLYFDAPCRLIYQPLKDPRMDRLLIRIRSRFGAGLIPVRSHAKVILRQKDQIVGIVADQRPRSGQKPFWTCFLGQETSFPEALLRLPYATGATVFFAGIRRVKRGSYEVRFKELAAPPYERHTWSLLKKYIAETEDLIKEDPAGWLWSHKRWKFARPENEEMVKL